MSLLLLLWPLWLTRRPEAESPLWARRTLILLITGLIIHYLAWRCTASLNLESPTSTALSLLLLIAESWLLLTGLLPLWLAWRSFPDRRQQALETAQAFRNSTWKPHVDILIPTWGEPLDVLERTLIGCLKQTYPHTSVFLLDDSNRSEVKALCHRLGCHYRHRPERANAKAGNLNDGLRLGRGELIAVFDADFIPQKRFLECSIGLLEDPGIGLVQTPQCFMNADPVMRNLGMERWLLPDEESFYRWIEPVRDGWGAVVCAGTSFVVKREALQQVGGFVEQALSEDFVTGIALRAKGWRLIYLQQKLSAGLAAESMLDFVRQRQRWAAGTLQSLHLKSGPLRARNLSIGQRLAYLEGVIHWFNNIPRLVLMLMPLSYGLLGITPINITLEAILFLLVPLWGTMLLGIGWLNRGSRAALLGELTSWVLTVPLTLTVISSGLGRRLGFQVTPKHQTRLKAGWSWALAGPLLVLTALNATNLIQLLVSLPALGPRVVDQGTLGLVWACLNLLGTLIALRACWDPAIEDARPWFAVDLEAWISDAGGHRHPCRIRAISEQGAELSFKGSAPPLVASSRVQWDRRIPALLFSVKASGASARAVAWESMEDMQHRALIEWLYGRDQCWLDRSTPQEWKALLVLLQRLLQGRPALGPLHRSLIPIAPHGSTSGQR